MVYQASAGSGKTFTIIKEYLKLCLKSKADIDNYSQILAITFTNMTANEMKEKIVKNLVSIIDSNIDEDPDDMEEKLIEELNISRRELKDNAQLLFTAIIHNYSNFFICTIDAFVQRLARSFAKELGLPTQFNVSIDEEEVADDITERIGEQIGSNDYLTDIVSDFAESKLNDEKSPKISREIHDFVRKLFKEESFEKSETNPFESEDSYKATLEFLNVKVYTFEAHCRQFVRDFSEFLKQYGLTDDDFKGKSRSACMSIYRYLQEGNYPTPTASLKNIIEGYENWYPKTSPKPQLDDAFDQAFINPMKYYSRHLGKYLFYKSQRDKLSLYVLRFKLLTELDKYIRDEQVVHISEFNKRINKVLGDFSVPFIYERLGTRFKHVFIDEFQDTSVLQWQNLIPLLHNGISSGQMSMVVGDGKQSIYRWRSGEVKQIAHLPEVYGRPEGDAFDDFERAFINHFGFHELKTNFRSFHNIVQFNNEFFLSNYQLLNEDNRKVYLCGDDPYGKEVNIEQKFYKKEQGYVEVELFEPDHAEEAMLERIGELIGDLRGKGFLLGDITILVRKNKHGSLVADYLGKQGIPVISADSILLKSSNKVRLIISALQYLIHPDNPVATATLCYYQNLVKREQFDGIADGFFDTAIDNESLQALMLRSYSLYDLCSALMRLYGLDSAGDTYLSFLLDVVYQWQSADEAGISDFLEYWEKKKNKLNVIGGAPDAVKVMTIHKSKGLEFDAVICPFVNDNLDDKKPATLWATPNELGFDDIPNLDKVQFTITKDSATWSNKTSVIAQEENDDVRLDNMNLLYVAFTRAIQRLHILGYKSKTTDKNPVNAFLAEHPASYGDPNVRKVEKKKDEKKPEEFYYPSQSSEWFSKISIDSNPSMFWANPNDKMKPQEWGEFVHQVLSEIRSDSDIDRALRPHLYSGVIDQATADMLKNLFLQMTTHPVIGEAFSPQAKVKNECDILLSTGKILRPDRYAELTDKVILLDYKTGKPNNSYHDQLGDYMDELSKMVAKPIVGYLVYLGDKIVIDQVNV